MSPLEPIERRESWHLDKRWHITQIVTMLIMVLTVIVYIVQRDNQYDKRLSMLESMLTMQRERDLQQDRDSAATIDLVRRQLDRIEDKLERAMARDFQLNGSRTR